MRLDELDLPFLDTLSPEYQAAFWHLNAEALAESWIVSTPLGPLVLEQHSVRVLLRDRRLRTVTMQSMLELQGVHDGPFWDRTTRTLLACDGDRHRRLRRSALGLFTPAAVDGLRPFMRETLGELLDQKRGDDRCDVVRELARSYAARVICELVGAPAGDAERLAAWAVDLMSIFDIQLERDRPRIERAQAEVDTYVVGLLRTSSGPSRYGLANSLLEYVDDEGPLDDDGVAMIAADVLVGGIHTTANQVALVVWALAQQPCAWESVAAEPRRAELVVEESLRWCSTAGMVFRQVAEDVVVNGVTIPAGTVLGLSIESANRDPSAYECPHAFDIEREPGGAALAFGAGQHHCLGANLARAELEEAVVALTARWTDVRIEGDVVLCESGGLIGPGELWLRFTERASATQHVGA